VSKKQTEPVTRPVPRCWTSLLTFHPQKDFLVIASDLILYRRAPICEEANFPVRGAMPDADSAGDRAVVPAEVLWAHRLRVAGVLRSARVLGDATERRMAEVIAGVVIARLSDMHAPGVAEPAGGWPPELVTMIEAIAAFEDRVPNVGVDAARVADLAIGMFT
jgi:hypothetical protein